MAKSLHKRFDSHDFVKAFIKASQSPENSAEKQAEVIIETIYEAQASSMDNAATKGDVVNVRNELKAEITNVRNELKADIELLKKDIIIKLGSLMAIGVGILAVLIKF